MARGPARSRWPLWLVAVVLVAALAYALYPVRIVVEGVGTVQPAFEDLVVMPDVSGMVTRVRVSPVQDVEQGTPLFEYIPDGQYAVQTHFTPTRPGTSRDAPAPLPEWYRAGQERRLTRDTALRHWTTRVYSSLRGPSGPARPVSSSDCALPKRRRARSWARPSCSRSRRPRVPVSGSGSRRRSQSADRDRKGLRAAGRRGTGTPLAEGRL